MISHPYYFVCLLLLIFVPIDKAQLLYLIAAQLSLFATVALWQRNRLILDTPSASLNSAAQGYVVLQGRVMPVAFHRGDNNGPSESPTAVGFQKESSQNIYRTFLLEVGKDRCQIVPDSAEVVTETPIAETGYGQAIFPGEYLYVMGDLNSEESHYSPEQRQRLVNKRLAELELHKEKLIDIYDTDNNQYLDQEEWKAVIGFAENDVDQQLDAEQQQTTLHTMTKPANGKPFLLSSVPIDALQQHYQRAMWGHLGVWVGLSAYFLLS